MVYTVFLSAWVLLVSSTTLQCAGTACRPGGSALARHPVATFPTREACETFRQHLTQSDTPGVSVDGPRPLTIRKELTTLCQERKEMP